jgi:hypothetical protein
MVNQTVLDYIKKYSKEYKLEDIKDKIISSGYTEADFDESVKILGLKPTPKTTPTATIKTIIPPKIKPQEKLKKTSSFNFLKVAGIAGIFAIVLFFITSMLTILQFPLGITNIIGSIGGLANLLFLVGFVVLGKKYKKNLIRVLSIIIIVLEAIILLFFFIYSNFPGIIPFTSQINSFIETVSSQVTDFNTLLSFFTSNLMLFAIILGGVLLITILLGILFGVGLLKLKADVKYARLAGILTILGFCTFILGIGIVFLAVAFIFEIVILLKS